MARDEGRGWSETAIAGLHIRSDGADGMRLLGWEGVLPLSVIKAVVVGPTAVGGTVVSKHGVSPSNSPEWTAIIEP